MYCLGNIGHTFYVQFVDKQYPNSFLNYDVSSSGIIPQMLGIITQMLGIIPQMLGIIP